MHNLINFTAENSWGNAWKQWPDSPPMINQHTEENILACGVGAACCKSSGLFKIPTWELQHWLDLLWRWLGSSLHHVFSCQHFVSNLSTISQRTGQQTTAGPLQLIESNCTGCTCGHNSDRWLHYNCSCRRDLFHIGYWWFRFNSSCNRTNFLVGCKLIFGPE